MTYISKSATTPISSPGSIPASTSKVARYRRKRVPKERESPAQAQSVSRSWASSFLPPLASGQWRGRATSSETNRPLLRPLLQQNPRPTIPHPRPHHPFPLRSKIQNQQSSIGNAPRPQFKKSSFKKSGSNATADFARSAAIAAELTLSDSKPGTSASPATEARNHLFDEVWEDLLAIAETARSIARKEPGFAADFRLGDDTHREIIATASAFLEKLQVPATAADFVADLQTDFAAIDGKKAARLLELLRCDRQFRAPLGLRMERQAVSSQVAQPPQPAAQLQLDHV